MNESSDIKSQKNPFTAAIDNYIKGQPPKANSSNTESAKQSRMSLFPSPLFRAGENGKLAEHKQLANLCFLGFCVACPPYVAGHAIVVAGCRAVTAATGKLQEALPKNEIQMMRSKLENIQDTSKLENLNEKYAEIAALQSSLDDNKTLNKKIPNEVLELKIEIIRAKIDILQDATVCDVSQELKNKLSELPGLRVQLKELEALYLSAINSKPMASVGVASKGGTYDEVKACCDYSYCDPNKGIMGVCDAGGHNDKDTYNDQAHLFRKLFRNISNAHSEGKFSNLENAKKTEGSKFTFSTTLGEIPEKHKAGLEKVGNVLLEELGKIQPEFTELRNQTHSYFYSGPALCCGVKVEIDEKRYFVGSQLSDACLYRRKKNGEIEILKRTSDTGLGDIPANKRNIVEPTMFVVELEEGDEIGIVSDGITEFLTEKEFKEVINATRNPDTNECEPEKMLENCTNKIKQLSTDENRNNLDQKKENRLYQAATKPKELTASQKPLEKELITSYSSSGGEKGKNDDISFAFMS